MDYYRDRCDLCGMVHEERQEHELIGYFQKGSHVLCSLCYWERQAQHLDRTVELLKMNVPSPYKQSCHVCGQRLVAGPSRELYEAEQCSVCTEGLKRLQADLGKRATVRMTIPVVVSLEVSVANVGPDQEIIQRAKEILRGCTFLIQDRDLENLDQGDYRLTWDTEPLEVQIMSAQ